MPVADADAAAAYLNTDIATAQAAIDAQTDIYAAATHAFRSEINHKQRGLAFIEDCKTYATDPATQVLDETALKGYILAAVNLLQTYHDAI